MPPLYRLLGLRYLLHRWDRAGLIVASIALGVATLVSSPVPVNGSPLSTRESKLSCPARMRPLKFTPGFLKKLASSVAMVAAIM